MKLTKLTTTLALSTVLATGVVSLATAKKTVKVTEAVNLPKNINLKDTTDSEIKNYYSSLSSLSASELSGTNLLKNLKSIISNNVTYYSYSQVTDAYLITDRDWINSPASAMSTYNASTQSLSGVSYSSEKDNNPYIHMLYHDYTNASMNKTRYTGDGDMSSTSKSFDNEHVWSQSHGFYKGSGDPLVGAGTDLHHLIAGTQYGNRTLHNNYSYGFVKTNDSEWQSTINNNSKPYEVKNKRGVQLFAHSQDQQQKVFEPQDCDKGDIARAMLYMVACYNNFDGSTPTPANPALNIQNYVIGDTTGYSSEDITKGYYGVLQDLLAWHRMDPVDEYEIHRNNIIYNSYQHNRNPFIDYPEWADYIWGVAEYDSGTRTISYDSTSTGHVNLSVDVINGYKPEKVLVSLEFVTQPFKIEYQVGDTFIPRGAYIKATYEDATYENVADDCTYTVDLSSVGLKTVTASYRDMSCTFQVNVNPVKEVKDITIAALPTKMTYQVGESFNPAGMNIIATYYDYEFTVEVTPDCTFDVDTSSAGTKPVTVHYRDKTATFDITVTKTPDPEPEKPAFDMKILIYIGIGVVAVVVIIGIFAGVLKVNKKGKVSVNKKGVKKIVKGKKKK